MATKQSEPQFQLLKIEDITLPEFNPRSISENECPEYGREEKAG